MKTKKTDGFIHVEVNNISKKLILTNTYAIMCEICNIRELLTQAFKEYFYMTGQILSIAKLEKKILNGILILNQIYEFDLKELEF